ncbi:MAG: redoxin domain-containing protein [Acidobacteriota bacterium]
MDKQSIKILILITFCFILVLWGISLHKTNKSNSKTLEENIQYLKLLKDPTLNPDGTSLIGTPFFNFSLKDLNGKYYQLASIQSLLKMIIFFDVNDCGLCLNEYRLWKKLYETYPSNKLTIFAICTTREKQSIINFIEDRRIKFPVIWDPERKVKTHMKFRQSPLRILLDQNNSIIDIEYTLTTTEHQQYITSMIESLIMKTKNK